MKIAVFIAILFGCFHGNQSLGITEGSFIIEDLEYLIIDMNARNIGFSLHLYNDRASAETIRDIDLYVSNDEMLSIKSLAKPARGVGSPLTLSPKDNDGSELQLNDLSADVSVGMENCDFYYYLCVSVSQGVHSCVNVRDSISCPGVETKKMKILSPAPAFIKYSTTAYTDITFSIECTRYRFLDVVGVKLYFTNGVDMSKNTTTYEGDVIEVTGMTEVGFDDAGEDFAMQPLYASPKVDVSNCAHYTHLCAVVFPKGLRGADICIPLGTTEEDAGTIVCPEEVEEPDSIISSECRIFANTFALAMLSMVSIWTAVQ